MICAPNLRVACTLLSGAVSGITIAASMPSRCALYATAWAWFPALALFRREQRELVGGAALLEGAGAVQVLQLEMNGRAAELAERLGERARRDRHGAAD